MDHHGMEHSKMDHSNMDHSNMDHHAMNHSDMDHSGHAGHNMAMAVVNTTMKAVMDVMATGKTMDHSGHDHMDHSAHAGHSTHMDMGDGGMDHGDGGMDHGDGGMDHMDMGGMSMSFHFGYTEVILFDFWSINTIGGLIGSMIGIFVLAALYEGLKYFREHLFRKSLTAMQYIAKVNKATATEEDKPTQMNMLSLDHGIQTLLHVVQMIISYFLMLIFMTYNVWLCIAVILGAALGYFLFGWRKSVVVDITEHCH